MNVYNITFADPNGNLISSVGRANNVPYAIQSALRGLARNGINVSGFKYKRHSLIMRAA